MSVETKNPHLGELKVDHLYHLGLDTSMDLKGMFGDVRFVFFGGSNDRMEHVAQSFAEKFWPLPTGAQLAPVGSTTRYHLYKVGQVISVSHQMGMASFSILLHEVTKLLKYADAQDVVFIRLGTSGGLGLEPGSIVVTDVPVNGYLEPYYDLISLGKSVKRPAEMDAELVKQLVELKGDFPVVTGKTMSVDCFYEGQGRLDGAICPYDAEDKMNFLKLAHEKGVRNIEMESVMFGAFCKYLGIRAGVVCTTLVNRLLGDQIDLNPSDYKNWIDRVLILCQRLVAKTLELPFDQ